MNQNNTDFRKDSDIIFLAVVIAGLYIISLDNFLLFHSLVELFSIVVAVAFFLIVWNRRNIIENNYILAAGIGYLFIASIDLLHTFAYKGMGIFPDYDANLPTQLWIAARYLESLILVASFFLIGKKVKASNVTTTYLIITTILIVSIFGGYFPDSYIEGAGLTSFKIYSEYLIASILLVALTLLHQKRSNFLPNVYKYLALAIVFTIIGELAFTFYISVYGFSNLVGHFFKLISFYLIYKAVIVTSLDKPYEMLFGELNQERKKYTDLFRAMKNGVAVFEPVDNGEDFLIKDINPAVEKIEGVKKEDVIGKKVTLTFPNSRETGFLDNLRKVWNTGDPIHTEPIHYCDSEREGWRENDIYKLANGDVVAVYEDVTEKKNTQRQQAQLTKELQTVNQILRHDISNDLSAISMSVDIFRNKRDDKYLDMIKRAVKKSISRINEMRMFEKTLDFEKKLKPFQLSKVFEKLRGKYDLKISIEGDATVMADEVIYSIFENLIENSIKHGKADIIDIKVQEKEDDVEVRVSDNGTGIPDSIKKKVFDEGFSTGKGGMGLYIVKTTMNRYGSIQVEDNDPHGARFVLRFKKYPGKENVKSE
jgi:signal transduction histidine kinase